MIEALDFVAKIIGYTIIGSGATALWFILISSIINALNSHYNFQKEFFEWVIKEKLRKKKNEADTETD